MKPTAAKGALQALDREFIDRVTAILSGGATIADQMSGAVRSCAWNSDTPPTLAIAAQPIAVFVLSATTKATPGLRVSSAAVTWEPTSSGVRITGIAGLTPSTDYLVNFWLVGG